MAKKLAFMKYREKLGIDIETGIYPISECIVAFL